MAINGHQWPVNGIVAHSGEAFVMKEGAFLCTLQDGCFDIMFFTLVQGQVAGKASWTIYESTECEI